MQEKYSPIRVLQVIQKAKYKKAIIPIGLVLLSLFLQQYYLEAKYLAGLGLILYFYIAYVLFRISKNTPPEFDREVVFSPIFGVVQSIEDDSITIKKSHFDHADFRLGISREKFSIESTGNLQILDKVSDIPGRLIGFMPGKGTVTCTIPTNFELEVVVGTRVLAGETILAIAPQEEKKEIVKDDEE